MTNIDISYSRLNDLLDLFDIHISNFLTNKLSEFSYILNISLIF